MVGLMQLDKALMKEILIVIQQHDPRNREAVYQHFGTDLPRAKEIRIDGHLDLLEAESLIRYDERRHMLALTLKGHDLLDDTARQW